MAAVAFAAGTLPYIAGALFLSGLADRCPRRTVMVAADAARMVLVAAMLAPRVPLEASAERLRHDLRRPVPGRPDLLTKNAGNTVREIDPKPTVGVAG
jgi:hypothetical protein